MNEERASEIMNEGSWKVVALIVPLTLCFLLSLGLVELDYAVARMRNVTAIIAQVDSNNASMVRELANALGMSSLTELQAALIIGLMMLVMVAIVTTVVVILYRYLHCLWCLTGYAFCAITVLLGFLGTRNLAKICSLLKIYVDYVSFFFVVWNVTLTGSVVLFMDGPTLAHQGYCVFYASMFVNYLLGIMRPTLILWVAVVLLGFWDLFAVLCPCGPLRMLVNTAQTRGDMDSKFLRALVYSAAVLLATESGTMETEKEEEEEERGPKLGLGDFIFYSVVICLSRVDSGYYSVLLSYIVILFGLMCTLVILVLLAKPLPALPIPIFLSVTVFFIYRYMVAEFHDKVNAVQVFL
ncbi:unnamed protein product [Notodromas monacha]|uniref:Presenilin n=1 Tax=Notodromas monacha TaxID=399045 RepID=A0A7R9BW87_9CRUS|nr:unnamed protein product [Notodromas monacha]CAG0921791.1 unnamed protein product [Notodromas monacha]